MTASGAVPVSAVATSMPAVRVREAGFGLPAMTVVRTGPPVCG